MYFNVPTILYPEATQSCITRPAYHVTESEQYMKVEEVRMAVYKVICLAVKHHGQSMAVQINMMQSLQFFEHLSEPMAECLRYLVQEFDYPQLGDEIIREISAKTFNAQDNKVPKSFARFLMKYAEYCPRSVLKQLSLLLAQLDSEVRFFFICSLDCLIHSTKSYPMRQAIIEVIGCLIYELANNEQEADPKQTQKQINQLFNLLLERVLDLSSYVRAKVFAVLAKLTSIKSIKFPKQRLHITTAAVSSLDDKVASVRKGAAALLVRLLETHPYGMMHGGMLQLEIWEADYKDAVAELDKIESQIGNVVNTGGEEQNEDEDEDKGNEDEEGGKKKKKSKEYDEIMLHV